MSRLQHQRHTFIIYLAALCVGLLAPTLAFSAPTTVVVQHSGQCLDVRGGPTATANGARIEQWSCTGQANQSWTLNHVGNGRYEFIAESSGKCMEVIGGSTANGAGIQQWDCNGSERQRWELRVKSGGVYEVVADISGRCLNVPNSTMVEGTLLEVWDCSGYDNQAWALTVPEDTTPDPQEVVVQHSGQCLDVRGGPTATANGARIEQWGCSGQSNQAWTLRSAGGGRYEFIAEHSGKCMEVIDGATASGAGIQQWDCNGSERQHWELRAKSGGIYEILSALSGKCLNVPNSTMVEGTLLEVWDCSGYDNQAWALTLPGDQPPPPDPTEGEYDPETDISTANHLYVAPTGSDSNPGTQAAPFRTILRASQVVGPDTTVHVAPGTYPGSFQTSASGTASGRIRYVSTEKWGAKIVPPSNSGSTIAWTNYGDYVDIVGFEVDGSIHGSGSRWLNGIILYSANSSAKYNHVHHIATRSADCSSNGGSGLNTNASNGGANNVISNNVIHHIGPRPPASFCNHIHGLYMAATGKVKNNLIYQIGAVGIHLWHDAHHIDIANNTVFASYQGILVGADTLADYVHVSNNIVFDNARGIGEYGNIGGNTTYTNNLVYQNSSWNWNVGRSHTGDINANPQFVNYDPNGAGDYRLQSTSPAVDSGSPTYAPDYDLDGVARPQGAAVDVGAYEYVP